METYLHRSPLLLATPLLLAHNTGGPAVSGDVLYRLTCLYLAISVKQHQSSWVQGRALSIMILSCIHTTASACRLPHQIGGKQQIVRLLQLDNLQQQQRSNKPYSADVCPIPPSKLLDWFLWRHQCRAPNCFLLRSCQQLSLPCAICSRGPQPAFPQQACRAWGLHHAQGSPRRDAQDTDYALIDGSCPGFCEAKLHPHSSEHSCQHVWGDPATRRCCHMAQQHQ